MRLTGNFLALGSPLCRFSFSTSTGSVLAYTGSNGTVLSATAMDCEKPVFPDAASGFVGAYSIAVTPDGRCFSPEQWGAPFNVYNAFVKGIGLTGAPSTEEVELLVEGEGFVPLVGGYCEFTLRGSDGAVAVSKPLVVLSSTSLARAVRTRCRVAQVPMHARSSVASTG